MEGLPVMTNQVTLVVQSFGRENEYRRTVLCIRSYYSHISEQYAATRTLLFTDAPEFFEPYLDNLPITYVALTKDKLRQMRGRLDFLHRIKIAIIEEAFTLTEDNILYVDGDAFFVADPSPFFSTIGPKVSFMHEREYAFETLGDLPTPSGDPFHFVLNYIRNREFTLANGASVKFSASLYSWNAGAIMLDRSHRSLLADVYAITDQLYAATKNHASEQFAFSLVLQTNTDLKTCSPVIHHYWHRIRKEIADDFLLKNLTVGWKAIPDAEKEARILKWTRILPSYFEKHRLMLRDNAIQSFNANRFRQGYYWSARALSRRPFDIGFFRDIMYHTRRFLFKK